MRWLSWRLLSFRLRAQGGGEEGGLERSFYREETHRTKGWKTKEEEGCGGEKDEMFHSVKSLHFNHTHSTPCLMHTSFPLCTLSVLLHLQYLTVCPLLCCLLTVSAVTRFLG